MIVELKSTHSEPPVIYVLQVSTRRTEATVKLVQSTKSRTQQEHVSAFLVELERNLTQPKRNVWSVFQDNTRQPMEPVKPVHPTATPRIVALIDASLASVDEKPIPLELLVCCVNQDSIPRMMELVSHVRRINSPPMQAHVNVINALLVQKRTRVEQDVFCVKRDSFLQTIKSDVWNVLWGRSPPPMELANVSNVLQEANRTQVEPIVIDVLLVKHPQMVSGVKHVQRQRFLPQRERENVLLANVVSKQILLEILVLLVLLEPTLLSTELVKIVHEATSRYHQEPVTVSNVLRATKLQPIELFA